MNGKHNLFWLLCWFWKIPCHCSVVIPTSSFRQMISTHLRTEGRKFPCSFFQFPATNQWKIIAANQIIHGKRPYHYSMVIPACTFRKIVINHFSPSRRVGFVSGLTFFHRTPYWLLVDAGFLTKKRGGYNSPEFSVGFSWWNTSSKGIGFDDIQRFTGTLTNF